jgi:O-antigen/teichoic acid export membrane protein
MNRLKSWRSPRFVARLRGLAQASPWWELILRSGSVLLVRVAGAGLGFAFNVALARVLGADGLGIYHLALTFALIASVVGRVGMDAALLKFGATSHAAMDGRRLAAVHRMGMGMATLGCGIVAASTFLAADWLAATLYSDPAIAAPLRLMSLALLPFALLNLYGELLKAGHHQALSSFVQGAALPMVSLLLLFVFAGHLKDASAAAAIYLAATVAVCLSSYVLWRRSVPRGHSRETKSLRFRELLGTAMPMYGSAIADVVMTFSDVLILGMFATATEVGIYTAAARTALLTRFLLLANSAVVAPRFAALHAANDKEGVARLALRSTLLTTFSSVPLLLIFIVFPEKILSLFGPQFEAGAQVLIVLSIGQFVNAMTGPVGYLLNMSGFHRIEGRIAVVGALMTAGLCFALIPLWGLLGAAAANAIATASCNLLRVYFAKSRLGILMLPIPTALGARRQAPLRHP